MADEHEGFMGEALVVARHGLERGEMPIGAVVVLGDEVVAAAHTQERTQGRLLVHADLLALEAADRVLGRRRADARLYVTLEPCLMCLGAAFTAMIGAVVYALESPTDGGSAVFKSWDETRVRDGMPGYSLPALTGGVRRVDAAQLFKEYADAAADGSWLKAWATDLAAQSGH